MDWKAWLKYHYAFITILIFYAFLFIPFIGNVHLFDWDEINFAEAAREMLVSGDWVNLTINFEPFWEKPPLFIWLQAGAMWLFGVNEFAARFPNVLVGLVTLCILYFTVLNRYSKQAAIFTVLFYIGSFTPHFYFKSGIIDPLFNLFIFLGALYLVRSIELKSNKEFFWSGVFLGLAVVTKGPVALLLVGVTGLVYQIFHKVNFYSLRNLLYLLVGMLAVFGVIFGIQVHQNGWWFLKEFFVYQVDLFRYPIASHGQPFYYHFVVLLIGCFPLFTLLIQQIFKRNVVSGDSTYLRWMQILFWVVLVIFSLVTTKIVHYSSMCYIPLAILGGVWLSKFSRISLMNRVLTSVVGMIWLILLGAFGYVGFDPDMSIELLKRIIRDDFVIAQLQTQVEWSIVPIFLAFLFGGSLLSMVYKPSKITIASFLVTNTLVITLLMNTVVPSVEKMVQGSWINHLKSYQSKDLAHFTYGFKSYAHRFYTHQTNGMELFQLKQNFMTERGVQTLLELDQHEKKEYDNAFRDFIIKETTYPVTVTAKVQKFDLMKKKYPKLICVFKGNGYGVWERPVNLSYKE